MFNREEIKIDFPQICELYDGKPIVYLDSAATNLKHKDVIESSNNYYSKETANIHRGIHTLSEIGTEKYEHTRDLLKDLINAKSNKEIIFTKGTTESINLVAKSWGETNLVAGDEILISHMEHHSNIVPWQMVCEKTGAKLKIIPIDDNGDILFDEYVKLLSDKTKLVSVVYISNSLGTVNPIDKMIIEAKKKNALFLVDAAQAISHKVIDVQKMDCDFLCFSAHKMFGPTGIGALYAKEEILDNMPPIFGGGDMIDKVTFEKTTYNVLPYKFEAGTPNISAGIAWAKALEYIAKVGIDKIADHEKELLAYATEKLLEVKGLKIIGTAKEKSAVVSFTLECCHPHDIATMANKYGVALRTGHHCTQPVMDRMNVPATARASFGIYNDKNDVDVLVETLNKIVDLFS
jgi:cysteine desulfurase/selenocysteine lyase